MTPRRPCERPLGSHKQARDQPGRPRRATPVPIDRGDMLVTRRSTTVTRPVAARCSSTPRPRIVPDAIGCAAKGGDIGPDLSDVGGKYERALLIESVLDPSRQIVEGYRPTIVATADGRVLSGLVKGESVEELTLVDVEGADRSSASPRSTNAGPATPH